MRVLITGGLGFIGHHVIDYFLEHTAWDIVTLDRIDGTSTAHRLRHVRHWPTRASRVEFVWHDLRAPINPMVARQIGKVDVVLHLAASTHVDRSIVDPLGFVQDNVVGTCNLLEWWREQSSKLLFLQFSTDEVFGPAPPGVAYMEWDRMHPTNPYSASKQSAEALAMAFANTYRMRTLVTRAMNIFGERQHHEKFVPLVVGKILRGEKIEVHANPQRTKAGSRFYLHAQNVGQALEWLVRREWGQHLKWTGPLDVFHIVGEREIDNLELVQRISEIMGKPAITELVNFHESRPGHDLRYALDGSKLAAEGFRFDLNLDDSLARTVRWFMEHPEWLAQ